MLRKLMAASRSRSALTTAGTVACAATVSAGAAGYDWRVGCIVAGVLFGAIFEAAGR